MNRRDLIKSAVALALYGPRFPARARNLPRTSANSTAAQLQGDPATPFPRTAIIGIGGDQSYGWDTYGTFLGQVSSNSIGSNGYFPGASFVNPIQWLGRFDIAIIGGVWEGWTSSGGRDRADLIEAIKQISYPAGASAKAFSYNIMEETASPPAALGSGQNTNGTADPTSYLSNEILNQKWYLYSAAGSGNPPAEGSDGTAYAETNWAVAWPNGVGSTGADSSFAPARVTAPDGTSEGPTDWAADYFLSLSLIRSTGYTGTASGTIPASSFVDSRWSWPYQMDAPNQDGLFIDNLFACPYVGGYYDLEKYYAGNSDAFDTPVCGWLMRGTQHFFLRYQTEVQKAYPGRTYYNFGNLASWQTAYVSGNWATTSNGIQNTMHGGVLEASIGTSHSIESFMGWYADINSLQGIVDFCLDPQLVIHATEGGGKGAPNYQLMRYGLTTALMGQAYHTCDLEGYDYSTALWYDEYGGNPGTNVAKGYLGNPKGSRPTAAAIGPVWVADFDNGVALCYPRTDQSNTAYTQTVTVTADQINSYLGTSYSLAFIQGTQNPSLNSGQAMTSVTLQTGGDGVILLHGASGSQTVTTVSYAWSGTSGTNVASQSVTRNIAVQKGDLLVAWVMGYGSSYPTSIADGQLGTLASTSSADAATSYPSFLKTYWAIATQDYSADSSNQVTAAFSPAASYINVIWALYRCPAGSVFGAEIASVGAAQNSPGTGDGAVNTGAVNIGTAPAFLVAGTEILGTGGATPTVYSSGWAQDFVDGSDNFAEASIFVSAEGNQECQWTAGSGSDGANYGNTLAGFSVIPSASSQSVSTVSYKWSGASGTNVTSQSVVRDIAIQQGDLLVAWVMGYGSTFPSSVTDGQLGALSSAGTAQATTAYPSCLKAYWAIASQDYTADASNQVTATFGSSTSYVNVIWALYRCSTGYVFGAELATVGAAQNAPGTGAGAINTGSVNIESSPAFLVAGTEILGLGGATPTVASSGWTQDFSDGTDNFSEASLFVTSQGAQECEWTAGSGSGGADYGNVLAGFSVVSSG